MTCHEVKPLLNVRLDGEIDPLRRAAVDQHVNACPSCSEDMQRLEHVRDLVRGEMVYEEAPPALRDRVRFALRGAEYLERRERTIDWRVWRAAAAVVAFVVLGSTPFIMSMRNQRRLIAEEILSAHERALVGHDLDVVSTDRHTVKPWFNGKISFSPPVTDLAADGFPLAGGRLDYAGSHAVAALVYHRRKHQIDVFVWPATGAALPPRHFERDGYNEIAWARNGFAFTAVSDLNAAELAAFARLLQTH